MNRCLRIATRRSPLALWQASFVRDALIAHHPGLRVELLPVATRGDRILDAPLAKIGGKGLFVKELEVALLEGRADLAVHSMKDVPMELPEGLVIGAICAREDPWDALVSPRHASLADLPAGARIGTSSLRRQSQLLAHRPDLRIGFLRGNVQTRLARLDEGRFDAVVLAAAGLARLGLAARIRERLPAEVCLPAVGQGAIGIECRADDGVLLALLEPLHHPPTAACVCAERAFNRRLEGGCQVPIAAHARWASGDLELTGLVAAPDGTELLRGVRRGAADAPEALGTGLAEELLGRGAARLLALAAHGH